MAKDKDSMIGGFDVFKAAQRAARDRDEIASRPDELKEAPPSEIGQPAKKRIGSNIGRTVMPTKHHIMCYECAYEFDIAGKVKSTFCPKCRIDLTFEDLTVSDTYEGDLKTAGTITITEAGVVKNGALFANFVILHGTVQGGSLHAYRELELGPAANVDWKRVKTPKLKILEGAEYVYAECGYTDIDVYGVLNSSVVATGTVIVRATGCVRGEVHAAGLIVEEGGGLLASLDVGGRLEEEHQAECHVNVL